MTIRLRGAAQSIGGEPERRGDERSEAPRSGGSLSIERAGAVVAPDSEVSTRHVRRRFTTAYKLEILRKADACTHHGELGALLRKEGLYSSHLITWRQQRECGLTPKKRGRKAVPVDPRLKRLEQENRRLTTRLQKAEALIDFQKNFRARREPRYLVGLKLPVRLLSWYPGRSGRLLFGDAAANP